jgi:hypothetical protein
MLTPPGTQYGATRGKPGERKWLRYGGFASVQGVLLFSPFRMEPAPGHSPCSWRRVLMSRRRPAVQTESTVSTNACLQPWGKRSTTASLDIARLAERRPGKYINLHCGG